MKGIIRTVGDLYFKQEDIRNTRYLPREMQGNASSSDICFVKVIEYVHNFTN